MNAQNISFEWYIPNRVVLVTMCGDITRDDILDGDEILLRDFLAASPADYVHLIFDHSEVKSVPDVTVHKQLQFAEHPRLGWSLSFGDSPVTRFFVSAMTQITGIKFRICRTAEQCIEFLADMDPTLPVDFWMSSEN